MTSNYNDRKKFYRALLLLTALLTMTLILSILLGAVSFSISDFTKVLAEPDSKQAYIIKSIRLPRTLAALFAGMGLAVSGAIIQTVFQNPLASPNIIGVNAGASFFVIVCGAFFPASIYLLPISAFCGAFFTAVFIFLLGKKTGFSKTSLVLAGLAINSLFNSGTDFICNLNDNFIISNKAFRMGSLSNVNQQVLLVASIGILFAILAILLFSNELEVMSLGYETATALGLSVTKYRVFFLLLAAILAGCAISFAGPISFVGLIIPHIVKLLHIHKTRWYLILSALMGALLVSICDLLARLIFRPHEIPVGIILSFIGVPFFLWLLMKRKDRK